MPEIVIIPNLDNYFQGKPPKKLLDVQTPVIIGALEGGMKSGNPSVGILVEIEPGVVALVQTSLKVFLFAADTLKTVFGDPRVGPTGPAA